MKKSTKLLCIAFILIELILFYLIIFLDTNNVHILSFLSIMLAGIFALICANFKNKKFLINLGLISTIFADLFLVLLNPQNKILGMIFFSITQILYFLFLYFSTKSKLKKKIHIISRIIIILLAEIITIMVLKDKVDTLSITSMFYISNLLLNIIFAFADKSTLLFAIGLTLFICCDILIGLQEAALSYLPMLQNSFIINILNSGYNIAWMFYLPSQVIISLFVFLHNIKKDVRI